MGAVTLMGIDPGNNGGIIVFQRHPDYGWELRRSFKLERGEDAIVAFLRDMTNDGQQPATAYLEKVHGWGTARSFNFGKYYGFVLGVLKAFGVTVVDVTPQRWMKWAGVEGKSQTREKRESMRQLAERRLEETGQELGVTNWNAAAILIAYYGLQEQ